MVKQVTLSSGLVKVMSVPAVWFAAAIAVSASGILYDPPRPLLPVLIWAPVLAFLVSYARSHRLRQLVCPLIFAGWSSSTSYEHRLASPFC